MELALVILSYNHPQHTAQAVESALNLECGNILLVHNGSQDNHVARLRREFPAIRHLIIGKNRGYAGGVNAGLTEAFKLAEWAVLLTNDSRLENLPVPPARPAIVAPKVLRRKSALVDSVGGLFEPRMARLVHCRTPEDFMRGSQSRGTRPYVPGTAFLVHRDVFRSTSGLDERLCIYWDDVDWSLRIVANGFPLLIDPEWRVVHKVGKTAHNNPLYSLYYFQRNRRLVSWRYTRGAGRAILSLVLVKEWLRLALRLVWARRYSDLAYLPRIIGESLPGEPPVTQAEPLISLP